MRGLTIALTLAVLGAGCEQKGGVRVLESDRLVVDGHELTLYGVDAPSSRKPACATEQEAGLRAKARLAMLTAPPAEVTFQKIGMACPIFLTCEAFVRVGGVNLGDTLISEGLALKREAQPHDWCAPPSELVN